MRFERVAPIVFLVLSVSSLTACGGDETTGAPCTPGLVVECPCPGASPGTQTCLLDGTFAACACGSDAGDVDDASDADTSTDTSADTNTSDDATDDTSDVGTDAVADSSDTADTADADDASDSGDASDGGDASDSGDASDGGDASDAVDCGSASFVCDGDDLLSRDACGDTFVETCVDGCNDGACGCAGAEDCPDPFFGEWSACGYTTACSESGARTRSATTFVCTEGACVPSSAPESEGCVRDTDGVIVETGEWGACGGFESVCDTTGTQARTNRVCSLGTETDARNTQPCTRVTDGVVVSSGAWGACVGFDSTCDTTGTQTRTTVTCSAGAETSADMTQSCTVGTDGRSCGADPREVCSSGSCLECERATERYPFVAMATLREGAGVQGPSVPPSVGGPLGERRMTFIRTSGTAIAPVSNPETWEFEDARICVRPLSDALSPGQSVTFYLLANNASCVWDAASVVWPGPCSSTTAVATGGSIGAGVSDYVCLGIPEHNWNLTSWSSSGIVVAPQALAAFDGVAQFFFHTAASPDLRPYIERDLIRCP